MQNLLVSIIIPVYKVEPYIVRCINSVLQQTYRNLEVILVDDCTPDHSMELAKECIAQSPLSQDLSFVYLKHDHNRGLSAARNTGIDAATGDYLYFLDSDDWIIPECISLMFECVKKEPGVEMVMGDIRQIGHEYPWPDFYIPNIETENIIQLACSYRIYTMAWNKLLLRSFITSNNLFFLEKLYHEDVLWNFEVACKLNKAVSIPQKTYNYFIREESIQTLNSYKFHFIHNTKVKVEMIKFVFENNLDESETIYRYITNDYYEYIYQAIKKGEYLLSKYYYKKTRSVSYWSLGFVISHCRSKLEKILAIHRYFPVSMGLEYIMFVNRIYYLFKRLFKK